jgi:cysteine synthase A
MLPSAPHASVLDLIGNTPLVNIGSIFDDCHFNLYAKLEMYNLGGSTKDRPAFLMVKDAMDQGYITAKTTVIESSSGNMGIGIAQTCLLYGLQFICVVDSRTNRANIDIMRAYGAKIEIVETSLTPGGSLLEARLEKVQELREAIPDSYWPNQYENKNNYLSHMKTMEEIARTLDDKVDYLFCTTGSCGTARGCSEYIKLNDMDTELCAVDAEGSVIFGGQIKERLIPGHGAAKRPGIYAEGMADELIYVNDQECVQGCQLLLQKQAILAGGSSGAVVKAVEKFKDHIPPNANVVVILADRGERYLDTIYNEAWVEHYLKIKSQGE